MINNMNENWSSYCPERGSIYMINLGMDNLDSEQRGVRPCLIIQNDIGNKNSSTISVAPLTSKKKNKLPVHIELTVEDGLRMDSVICLEQTRVVSKRRLFYNGFPIKVMQLSKDKMSEVNMAIGKQFGIISCVI